MLLKGFPRSFDGFKRNSNGVRCSRRVRTVFERVRKGFDRGSHGFPRGFNGAPKEVPTGSNWVNGLGGPLGFHQGGGRGTSVHRCPGAGPRHSAVCLKPHVPGFVVVVVHCKSRQTMGKNRKWVLEDNLSEDHFQRGPRPPGTRPIQ